MIEYISYIFTEPDGSWNKKSYLAEKSPKGRRKAYKTYLMEKELNRELNEEMERIWEEKREEYRQRGEVPDEEKIREELKREYPEAF